MVPVRALLYCLCGVRQVSAAAFHGQELADGIADGQGVFVDPVPVLLCGVREAGGGRNPAGHQRHGAVHGRHVHGSDPAGGLVLPPVRLDRLRPGHMVLLACGLDHRYGDVPFLLPEGLPQAGGLNWGGILHITRPNEIREALRILFTLCFHSPFRGKMRERILLLWKMSLAIGNKNGLSLPLLCWKWKGELY